MPNHDPRIDAYIAKSPEFSRPVLELLRAAVHEGCPQVQETMKWSRPHFEYHGLLCGMSAFKAHCSFSFWQGRFVVGDAASSDGMGQYGRITSVKDLPSKRELVAAVKKAAKLNEQLENEQASRPPKPAAAKKTAAPKTLEIPKELTAALKGNDAARATFEAFSYSHKKEYVEWITEAKTEATRDRRLASAVEMLAGGKSRHWKYQSC